MRTNKGFTLTEVLLGVMIVGIIGISLAALTTSASRDSGKSSSKIMLRNNLSIFLRQLRQDVHDSNRVISVNGALSSNADTLLLRLAKNQTISGTNIRSGDSVYYITYCYIACNTDACHEGVSPSDSYIGGQIKRLQSTSASDLSTCKNNSASKVMLNNVKFVKTGGHYPLFDKMSGSGDLGSLLRVELLVEIPSTPIINDVVEDIMVLPNGF